MKKDVFISYSSHEIENAKTIRSILETNGISCWMAPDSIPAGSNYTKEIPNAINNCKVFLLLISRNALNSKWVPLELDRAYNRGKIIIPYILEHCSLTDDFNFMLAKSQRIEAYNRKSEALEQLTNTIKAILSGNAPDTQNQLYTNSRNQKKKTLWTISVIAVVLLLILTLVFGFLIPNRNRDNNQTTGTAETVKTIESYVTEGWTGIFDDINQKGPITFRLPRITMDSNDSITINKEIEETYAEVINAVDNNKTPAGYNTLDYTASLNSDVLSICISSTHFYTNVYNYNVYNFDVTTGDLLTNNSLCKKMDSSWNELTPLLISAIEEYYHNNATSFENTEFMYNTISGSNLNSSKLYIDSDGNLHAVVSIHTGAGAGVYDRDLLICHTSELGNSNVG